MLTTMRLTVRPSQCRWQWRRGGRGLSLSCCLLKGGAVAPVVNKCLLDRGMRKKSEQTLHIFRLHHLEEPAKLLHLLLSTGYLLFGRSFCFSLKLIN